MRRAAVLTASLFLFSSQTFDTDPAHAAAGALDPSFGQRGTVILSLPSSIAEDAVLQPKDGKIVIATIGSVVRLLPNGSLDPQFGSGGVAQSPVGGPLALQPDGKIVDVGAINGEFAVARFNSDGTADDTFGTGGTATTNLAGLSTTAIGAVVIYPGTGQILFGGSAHACSKCAFDTVLIRYNPDGSLDPAFGNGGAVVIKAITSFANPTALALLSDGDILAVGGKGILEFGPTGSLHSSVTSTVSGATIVATSQGGSDVFLPNGDFVDGATVTGEGGFRDHDIQLLRFLPQGGLDSTFNSPVFDFGAEPNTGGAGSVVVQPNGQILVRGEAGQFGAEGFVVARFNADGSFDKSFGNAGIVTTPFPNATTVEHALLLQPDGRIIAVGSELINGGGPVNLVAVRYLGQ
jgi:uncharacterized delta-60 repeat protein